jgi:hypothetical protein
MSINKEEDGHVKLIPKPSLEAWIKIGIAEGYCSPVYCTNHERHAIEDRELYHSLYEAHDGNFDFCWPVVRLHTLPFED